MMDSLAGGRERVNPFQGLGSEAGEEISEKGVDIIGLIS